ncbi:MAG: electron transfer flavoprotein subunit beta/FixA family protein [Anaerolineales bacterium]|nr:electron transfer flavoprotein subunit beta/FixA family protein [Anaerolineales bacterium]MCB9126825.1 electron transfer flavoprotein subunit beta/FixA family protein [Ardenticatenales bacterium]
MRIIIPMKRVPDTETKIEVRDGQVDSGSLKSWIINPYDEYALEEALRLVESAGGGEIVLVTIGPDEAQETIRKGLAMGADAAYHLVDDGFSTLDSLGRARVLAAAIEKIGDYDLIWGGKKGVDDDLGQTAVMVAHLLDLPQVTNVITVEEIGGGSATVRAEGDGGYETVRVPTPAVLTETQGPNEPRFPSLKGIMGAKKKPFTTWSAADLGLDLDALEARVEWVEVVKPPARAAGRILEGDAAEAVKELVRLLHDEAKVLA